MSIVSSNSPVVSELLKALGFWDIGHIAAVNIDIQAGSAVKVVVGFYVEEEILKATTAVIRERELYLAQGDGEKADLSCKYPGQDISDIARLLESSYKKAPAVAEAA